jgi:hypothetical protein
MLAGHLEKSWGTAIPKIGKNSRKLQKSKSEIAGTNPNHSSGVLPVIRQKQIYSQSFLIYVKQLHKQFNGSLDIGYIVFF